ncbi:MAG: helix-turn-helix domain-containing protein [Clostridiales bacterium]|jgi:transcriptional regulator with XRE-family HTH domain|nr:helix-turn-helix domain-containing protein [Clostridiales bacterium]
MFEEFLARRLSELRLAKGVSARKMSKALGQNPNHINRIENRTAMPSMYSFFYICDYLGVSPKEFFDTETDNPTLVNEFVTVLKQLDEASIKNLLAVAQNMINK